MEYRIILPRLYKLDVLVVWVLRVGVNTATWQNHSKYKKKKKKNRKLSKKDIFVTNETKKCVFCNNFIFFMKLRLNF